MHSLSLYLSLLIGLFRLVWLTELYTYTHFAFVKGRGGNIPKWLCSLSLVPGTELRMIHKVEYFFKFPVMLLRSLSQPRVWILTVFCSEAVQCSKIEYVSYLCVLLLQTYVQYLGIQKSEPPRVCQELLLESDLSWKSELLTLHGCSWRLSKHRLFLVEQTQFMPSFALLQLYGWQIQPLKCFPIAHVASLLLAHNRFRYKAFLHKSPVFPRNPKRLHLLCLCKWELITFLLFSKPCGAFPLLFRKCVYYYKLHLCSVIHSIYF